MALCHIYKVAWIFSCTGSLFVGLGIAYYCFNYKKNNVIISQKKAIIFDLGNVLIKTNRYKVIRYLGLHDVTVYSFFNRRSFSHLQSTLCQALDNLFIPADYTPLFDPQGQKLPSLFCHILNGTHTETQAQSLANKALDMNSHLFYNKREARLGKKVIDLMFDPTILIDTQELIPEGFLLVKKCVCLGHEVFICSNMGAETFELLKQKFPELFSLIPKENIIISAHVKAVKPEKSMYDIVCETVQKKGIPLHPTSCFFIDDQYENVKALESFPITGIHKKSFKTVKSHLRKYGLLKKQTSTQSPQ